MIISLRMNGSMWFFHFRYLHPIEIYHRNICHRYKQTNVKWIKEDEKRDKDMKQYTMNWDQTNTSH